MKVLILGLALLITGCAGTTRAIEVTGDTLKAAGEGYLSVEQAFYTGCTNRTLPPAQCAAFNDFGAKFKKDYPRAVQLWHIARAANDTASQKKARDTVLQLSTALSTFAAQVIQTGGLTP